MATRRIRAKVESVDHYAAATSYLELLVSPAEARRIVARLHRANTIHKKAKDLLRASGLDLLPRNNSSLGRHMKEIRAGAAIAPLLLVRGRLGASVRLTIAEGYHHLCAAYYIDEDTEIPCRIVSSD